MRTDSAIFPRYPGETLEAWEIRACKEVLYALEELKDLFGYEAVYFRVGIQAFPDAVNPWEEPDMY